MNICYMAPDVAVPHYRGASTHVYELSKNLAGRGHRVTVVSRRLRRSQPRWESIDGFETFRTFQGLAFEPPGSSYSTSHVDREVLSPFQRIYSWYLRSYRAVQLGAEVATIMSGRGIEIVVERETAFGAGAVLSSLLRVPMVLEMIGPRVSALSLKRASKVIAYSTLMVGGRIPSNRLEVVPGGVNTKMFSPDRSARERIRSRHNLDGKFVVGYVGTFQAWHGVNELLSAVKKLGSSVGDIKVLLVGPYFAEAMKFAVELGIAKDSDFVGPVPYESVPEYMNACDVLCAPYDPRLSKVRSERGIGAPLKILEYMACEKALVSTNIGPIADVVENGRTGLLVPPGDVDALAVAIGELIENPGLSRRIGQDARKEVIEKYSWTSLAATLEEILNTAKGESFEKREALS